MRKRQIYFPTTEMWSTILASIVVTDQVPADSATHCRGADRNYKLPAIIYNI